MAYPATIEVQTPPKIANWRPLVQWLLAIPHLIVSYVLMIVAEVCGVIAWFAILFTGKMPQGLANMICLAIRYQSRTSAYAGFLHDQYPHHYANAITEDHDAETGDVYLQLCLFGELIFG